MSSIEVEEINMSIDIGIPKLIFDCLKRIPDLFVKSKQNKVIKIGTMEHQSIGKLSNLSAIVSDRYFCIMYCC